ncbi:hypothetical protein BD626DRAFT_490686 [Schizophyllum amplum]|uniref:Uncharacterized protein n=1 Tax=Schizophyllum amplum TaxID=97359 RepID=A0A550CJQ8_9AGAR|nr:hypothetical protein BD626DRAFT_490686 [Auriculariopsis ampla]
MNVLSPSRLSGPDNSVNCPMLVYDCEATDGISVLPRQPSFRQLTLSLTLSLPRPRASNPLGIAMPPRLSRLYLLNAVFAGVALVFLLHPRSADFSRDFLRLSSPPITPAVCPSPHLLERDIIAHDRQSCQALDSVLPDFDAELCRDLEAPSAFTFRVWRRDEAACAAAEDGSEPSEDPSLSEWIRRNRGPDSFILTTDGAERIDTQWSTYEGNCSYRFDVELHNVGDIYVRSWLAYERYEGFDEANATSSLPWPELQLRPLLAHALFLPANSLCQSYIPSPLNASHHLALPGARFPVDDDAMLPACSAIHPVRGSYLPHHPLDLLDSPIQWAAPGGRRIGERYRFVPARCKWRHSGMRFANVEECTETRRHVMSIGDSHGRQLQDGLIHRLSGQPGVALESGKADFKNGTVGNVDFFFRWSPFGHLFKEMLESDVCSYMREHEVDVLIVSVGYHIAVGHPTAVFLERTHDILDAVDICFPAPNPPLDERQAGAHGIPHAHTHGRPSTYTGPRTRIMLTPAAPGPLTTDRVRRDNRHTTHNRLRYWSELMIPLALARGWSVIDQFALTAPLAWETLVSDGIHFMMTDAHEALVDEALGKMGICAERDLPSSSEDLL